MRMEANSPGVPVPQGVESALRTIHSWLSSIEHTGNSTCGMLVIGDYKLLYLHTPPPIEENHVLPS